MSIESPQPPGCLGLNHTRALYPGLSLGWVWNVLGFGLGFGRGLGIWLGRAWLGLGFRLVFGLGLGLALLWVWLRFWLGLVVELDPGLGWDGLRLGLGLGLVLGLGFVGLGLRLGFGFVLHWALLRLGLGWVGLGLGLGLGLAWVGFGLGWRMWPTAKHQLLLFVLPRCVFLYHNHEASDDNQPGEVAVWQAPATEKRLTANISARWFIFVFELRRLQGRWIQQALDEDGSQPTQWV